MTVEALASTVCFYEIIIGPEGKRKDGIFTMKKILALALAIMMIALTLTSCGGIDATQDYENVLKNGKIVVGMECAYAPYNWTVSAPTDYTVPTANGAYADGYDVQIAKLIASELGVALEIVAIEWDGLIPALEQGEIDMIIAGMSPTAERKLSIDFTDTYYDSELVMVVRKDGAYTGATSIQDFSGATITGQLNTFHYSVIDQISGVNKDVARGTFTDLIMALEGGVIDGYVCEKPGAISAVEANDAFTYVEFAEGEGFVCDPAESSISVGIRKDSNLGNAINAVLRGLTTEQKQAMMDAAIARQPVSED